MIKKITQTNKKQQCWAPLTEIASVFVGTTENAAMENATRRVKGGNARMELHGKPQVVDCCLVISAK